VNKIFVPTINEHGRCTYRTVQSHRPRRFAFGDYVHLNFVQFSTRVIFFSNVKKYGTVSKVVFWVLMPSGFVGTNVSEENTASIFMASQPPPSSTSVSPREPQVACGRSVVA
jgi:hypothetical protein